MSSLRHLLALICLSTLLASAACNRGAGSPSHTQGGTKRYSLKGKVISVNKPAGNASIYNDPTPGFMDPMAMPYTIMPAATLDQLQPGDSITADVVVEPDKYWLENVQVTAIRSRPPKSPRQRRRKPRKNK